MTARLALAACALAACVDTGPGPQPRRIDPSIVKQHLLAQVPATVEHVDVDLDGKVVYVGSVIDPPAPPTGWAPGATITIKHYWKVIAPPGPSWRVFAMVKGAPNTADFVDAPASDMQVGHPVADWKAGEIIEDAQPIVLRPDWHSKTATIFVGLIAVGAHGTGDRMRAAGPHTVDRAVIARQLDVDLAKAPPPAGTVYIPHASGPITIDGQALEPAWASAAQSPEFVVAEGSPDPLGKATARMLWDEQNLYVFVSVTDTDVYSEYKQHDDPLWKQDAVELFIDADGNRRGYVELQVNPNNATFDSWFAGPRAGKGDEAWDSGMVTAVKMRGTADVANDTDQGWDVEIAIPLAAVKGRDEAMGVRVPPGVGDRWHLNVVRVDKKSDPKSPVSASSWNRITYSDFHALERMLTVVFADPAGSIIPKPAPPAPPPVLEGSGSGSGSAVGSGSGSAAASRLQIRRNVEATGPAPAP